MFERSVDLENWEPVQRHKVEYALKKVFGDCGVEFGMDMIERGMCFSAGNYHYRHESQREDGESEFESIGKILSNLDLVESFERN